MKRGDFDPFSELGLSSPVPFMFYFCIKLVQVRRMETILVFVMKTMKALIAEGRY